MQNENHTRLVSGLAGRLQLKSPIGAITTFSLLMAFNALLCSLGSLLAAKCCSLTRASIPGGLCFLGLGAILMFHQPVNIYWLACGMLVFSIGKIVFNAAFFPALIALVDGMSSRGKIIGISVLMQSLGKIAGGTLALPLFVYSRYNIHCMAVLTVSITTVAIAWIFRRPDMQPHATHLNSAS